VTVDVLAVVLASASPISELRGGIPLGIALGLPPAEVFALSVGTNILVFFPARAVLVLFYRSILRRLPLFERYLQRVRQRGSPKVEKYGLLGLALFVGIPLPFTGAYTGTVLSWLLAMDVKRSFAGVVTGVMFAGAAVMALTLGVASGAG